MATSKFSRWFHNNGVSLSGANIWLVPQANTYPTNALQLTPHPTKLGVYEYDNLADGEYKIYIDLTGGTNPILNQEEYWIGEQRLTGFMEALTADVTTYNVSTTRHGLMPKLPDNDTLFLNGKGEYVVPPISGSVNTALNYTWTGRHDFRRTIQLDNALRVDISTPMYEIDVSARTLLVLRPTMDTGILVSNPSAAQIIILINRGLYKITWPNNIVIPAGAMVMLVYHHTEFKWYVENAMIDFLNAINQDVTLFNASSTKHGLLPKLPNDPTKFLNGIGEFVELSILGISALVPLLISGWYKIFVIGFGPSGIVLAS
ncbi:MAG: hypothetical protein AB1432_05455 [Bacteroidota bacterium]